MFYRRALLALITIVILYLSLMPAPPSDGLGWDKLNHAGAMALVTFIAYLSARPVSRPVLFAALYAMSLGILVEVLQGMCTTARFAEWLDLVADGVGVVFAVLALKICQSCSRWGKAGAPDGDDASHFGQNS